MQNHELQTRSVMAYDEYMKAQKCEVYSTGHNGQAFKIGRAVVTPNGDIILTLDALPFLDAKLLIVKESL